MTVASQSGGKSGDPFYSALCISGVASILLFATLLRGFGVSLAAAVLVVGTAALLWLAYRHPVGGLGIVLAFMPIYPLAFLLAKLFGPSYIAKLEGCDRVVLLLLTGILWWRNGIELAAPDWFLLATFGVAVLRLAFGGLLLPLLSDFNFVIAYAAGRVVVLNAYQERVWARRAVWIVAVLSVVGLTEVFVFGGGPRTALYLAVAEQATLGGELNNSFHAFGYGGLRESATMLGPLHFAPLCMAAGLVWWVYFRNLLPAAMIAAGLICTVTRSAWLGTAVAIPFLAIIMGQTKRLFLYGTLALALFAAAVPILGLSDYLFSTKTVEDPSAADHQRMLSEGLHYMADHPLGVGPGNAGRWAIDKFNRDNAFFVDDTYLTFAAEYGIPAVLCFFGFLCTALWLSWGQRTQLGYLAVGTLVGFSVIMTFFDVHDIFPLASWIWFPVGLAVRSAASRRCQGQQL